MRTVMLRYAHALFNQVAQSAACNHFHYPAAALLPLGLMDALTGCSPPSSS
jgi:hypothetical protein